MKSCRHEGAAISPLAFLLACVVAIAASLHDLHACDFCSPACRLLDRAASEVLQAALLGPACSSQSCMQCTAGRSFVYRACIVLLSIKRQHVVASPLSQLEGCVSGIKD